MIQNRSTKETIDFFDAEWHHQEFVGLNPVAGPAAVVPQRPLYLEVQVGIARILSKILSISRIDLYNVGKKTFFGEITLYPASGWGIFTPVQYSDILGEMLKLPEKKE